MIVWLAVAAAFVLPPPAAAQLASRPVDEWVKVLESPERVAGLKIDEVIAGLRLEPGQVVADLGAGTGLFSVPLAKAVGPKGKVYAVEIDAGFLDYIRKKASDPAASNVVAVLGKPLDPALPAADVDLAFLHDVIHHVADREGYLKQMVRYLKPSGRVAVVDLNPVTSPHKDDPTLQVSKEQCGTWMAALGFTKSQEIPLAPDKWFVVYSR
jgi:ubiquinone/menaquinone biosynthesis C-methylase UbiE